METENKKKSTCLGMSSRRCYRISWQFLLLIYKNFKLQFRRPIGTLVELFLPIVAVVFLIVLRRYLNFRDEERCFTTFEPDPLKIPQTPDFLTSDPNSISVHDVYYTPRTPETLAIMKIVGREVGLPYTRGFRIMSFDSEEEILENLKRIDRNKTMYNACLYGGVGVIFNILHGKELKYTIRLPHEVGRANSWKTIQTSPNFELPGPRRSNLYLFEGFVQMQKLVGDAIIEWYAKEINRSYHSVNVSVRQLPYPEYTINEFLSSVNIILPLIFVLAFLYTAGTIVKELVLEKETRIRESMLMMGLKQWVLWLTWFIKQLLFLAPTMTVITFLVKFLLFKQSDWMLLFIFFVLYLISMISFAFLVSVWFTSARVGLIIGFIAWFANFFPFLFLFMRYRSISFSIIALSCLLSNTALGFGVEIIARLEQRTVGLLWSNVANPITLDDSFNMSWVLGMLLIDSIFYMTVAWYVNEIKPGKYGVPKPFYFFLLPSYWCNTKRILKKSHNLEPAHSAHKYDLAAHEKVRGNAAVGISIKNLTKIYSGWFGRKGIRKKAVDNLNLEIYKGQITALLGHNGAGKTTTMSILTGLYTPSRGTAVINGYDILTDMDLIRDSLGICPQHNVLFDRLTVREHLNFFIQLKGIHNRKVMKIEVDKMLEDLFLQDKANVQASCLSGGMKRKLSVGIALIGGSEIVILDEPTAGMDPYARRATWDLLVKYKKNCCILMSTHLMDEADLLGDRIAIMAEGVLRCSGSSLFLKSRYGVGYHMTLVKESTCITQEIERIVKSFVPMAEVVTDVGMELSFILPSSEASRFPNLFDVLESKKEELGISSYGISITTMEEVFIKVGEGTDETLNAIKKKKSSAAAILKRRSRKIMNLSLPHSQKKKIDNQPKKILQSSQDKKTDKGSHSINISQPSHNRKTDEGSHSMNISERNHNRKTDEGSQSINVSEANRNGNTSDGSDPKSISQSIQSKKTDEKSQSKNISEPTQNTKTNPSPQEAEAKSINGTSMKSLNKAGTMEPKQVLSQSENDDSFITPAYESHSEPASHSRRHSLPGSLGKISYSTQVGATSDEKRSTQVKNVEPDLSVAGQHRPTNSPKGFNRVRSSSVGDESISGNQINKHIIKLPPLQTAVVINGTSTAKTAGSSLRGRHIQALPPIQEGNHSKESRSVHTQGSRSCSRKSISCAASSDCNTSLSGETETTLSSGIKHWMKLSYNYEPNQGFTLWLQQFRGMFIKRIYYSIRFYPALITQLLFPVLFVSIGLMVIMSNPKDDDPPRALYLENCGLDSRNTTVFYAEMDGNSMDFSDFSAKDLLVTDYFDITSGVNDVRDAVEDLRDVDDCCNYKYQILDKFCASRNAYELKHCKKLNPSFGYGRCTQCLTCCDSVNKIDSCTFPTSVYISPPTNASDCPTPPSLSLYSSTIGPLDTTNTYIAEYLLRMANKFGAVSFYRSYQAGFTISTQDPTISGCDCGRKDGISDKGCSIFERLGVTSCHDSSVCPVHHYVSPYMCPAKTLNETLCRTKPSCFSVEPYSADFLQSIICSADGNRLCGVTDPNLLQYSYPPPFTDQRSYAKVHPEVEPLPAVTVWYNNGPYHMIGAAFNAYQSLRLKQVTGIRELSLIVVNHPLPRNPKAIAQDATEDFTGFGLAILVVCGYSFFLGNFIVFLVREKESKAKHLQFVSGVSVTSYWLSALAWDLINAFLPIFLTLVVFRGFPLDAFHGSSLTSIMLVLVLTCWAGIPFTYILSFFFKSALAAFSVVIIIFFFFTVLLLTAVFLVQLHGKENKEEIADMLHHVFLVTPTYGLASLLSDIYINHQIMQFCPKHVLLCDILNLTYVDSHLILRRPGVGVICIYLTIQGFAFIAITLLLEWKLFIPNLKRYFKTYKELSDTDDPREDGEDEDVYAEKMRVMAGNTPYDIVVIKHLIKTYRAYLLGCTLRPPKTAVAGITLGIPRGECFGLLGVNGAGKTTTFSILTGDINMTSGTAIIDGKDIRTSLKSVRQGLGYCPQFDALIERMTSREQLRMYARLRGVPEKQINEVVDSEIRRLDLIEYADARCGTYSGGVKRKLSTAIAIVGNPPLILLDEPTTGMDPNTRRYLWDVLTKLVKEGRSIILTSHSMEECEALCTRLAIMVNGQFKCLGSIQHLKNKFGKGITLQAKVHHPQTESIVQHDRPDAAKKSRSILTSLGAAHSSMRRSGFFRKRQSEHTASGTGNVQAMNQMSNNTVDSTFRGTTAALHSFIREHFEGSILMEEHAGAVTYWLPSDGVSWSSVFRLLEENKTKLNIVDYSVSQTTLEQVFINFAKEQEEDLEK